MINWPKVNRGKTPSYPYDCESKKHDTGTYEVHRYSISTYCDNTSSRKYKFKANNVYPCRTLRFTMQEIFDTFLLLTLTTNDMSYS